MSRSRLHAPRPDVAVFAATSGHSGVDRILANLVPAMVGLGVRVDVLGIEGHGPRFDDLPPGACVVPLSARHAVTALPSLCRYLAQKRPHALLSDKDRVNRVALAARFLSRSQTRVAVRLGTTVSVNLRDRGWLERNLQRASMRWVYPAADAVVVPSKGAAKDLVQWAGVNPARLHIIPSPVVTERIKRLADARPAHPWMDDPAVPVVLGVGELSERKDFATLVRAFAIVAGKRPCRLVILGEGRKRRELEALAEALGLSDCVALPGFDPNPYAYLARAAVFALSSRWEGLPVALVEALALGVSSVACDCPSGPHELLGETGLGGLVAVGDHHAMAGQIEVLIMNPHPRARCRDAVQAYHDENSARRYLEALGFPEFITNEERESRPTCEW